MPDITATKLLALASAILMLVAAGCGDGDRQVTPIHEVTIKLKNGTFASSTPDEFEVPADSLVIVEVIAGDGGPFRFGLVGRTTAQTFKLDSGDRRTITLASLKPGDSVRMYSGRQKRKMVAVD